MVGKLGCSRETHEHMVGFYGLGKVALRSAAFSESNVLKELLQQSVTTSEFDEQSRILKAVREFDSFSTDTEPYHEHVFGAVGNNCFKIDCFDSVIRRRC